MTVHLTPELEQRLQRRLPPLSSRAEDVAQEAVHSYLNHIEELAAAVREGEESAEREGWLTHEEVFERLNERLLKTA